MDGDFGLIETKIREAINNGKLTKQRIGRGVWTLINTELSQHDQPANTHLIEQCEDLLDTLDNIESPFDSNIENSLLQAKSKLAEHRMTLQETRGAKAAYRIVRRIALVSIVFILLFGGIGVLSYGYWLSGFSTPDEQQYVIQGYELDPRIISQGIAEHDQNAMIQTNNWADLVDFLGFVPNVPDLISSKWYADNYVAFVNSKWIYVTTIFDSGNRLEAPTLVLDIYYFTDIDEARISFEQDCIGVETDLCGKATYISENVESSFACWINGNVVYNISGNVSSDEICQIASELIGGSQK